MSARNALPALLACALAVGAFAPAVHAAPAAAAAEKKSDAAGDEAQESQDWADWIKQLDASAQKLRELRHTEGELQAAVNRAISERYPRGEERARLFAALERAKADLAEAEQQHPELLEQARQAGVPQGLLQDYEVVDEAPASTE